MWFTASKVHTGQENFGNWLTDNKICDVNSTIRKQMSRYCSIIRNRFVLRCGKETLPFAWNVLKTSSRHFVFTSWWVKTCFQFSANWFHKVDGRKIIKRNKSFLKTAIGWNVLNWSWNSLMPANESKMGLGPK